MTSEIRANKQTNRVGLGTVEYTNTGIVVSGIVTANSFSGPLTATSIDLNGDLDVDGHTNLDNVNIAGVTTSTQLVNIVRNASQSTSTPLLLQNSAAAGNGSDPDVVKLAFGSQGAVKASIRAAVYGEGHMAFHTNNDTEKVRITAAGSVLIDTTVTTEATGDASDIIIGTTSDTQKGISIVGSTSGGIGNLYFTDGAGYKNQGRISYHHADDSMRLQTNQYERLRITSNGAIQFNGTSNSDNTNKLVYLTTPSYDTDEEPFGLIHSGTYNNQNLMYLGGGMSGASYNACTLMKFYTTNSINTLTGTERLCIESWGGIQNNQGAIYGGGAANEPVIHFNGAAPSNDADRGQLAVSDSAAYNASPIARISLVTRYNSAGGYTFMGGIEGGKENTTDGQYGGFVRIVTRPHGSANQERLRITSDGNIGAGGITSPLWTSGGGIHLNDNYGIGFGNGGSGRPDFQLMVTDGSKLEFRCGFGADTADISMDTNGRLLIGTTSPSISSAELFEVKSSSTGFSHFRNNASGYATIYIDNEYSDTGFAPLITFTDGGGNRGGIGQDNNDLLRITGQGGVSFYTAGTHGGGTEKLLIKSNGHVSISSDGSADGLLTIKGNSDATSTPSIRLLDGSDTREVSITNSSGDFIASTHGTDNAEHGSIKVYDSGIIALATNSGSGNAERLRVDLNGSVRHMGTAGYWQITVIHNGNGSGNWYTGSAPQRIYPNYIDNRTGYAEFYMTFHPSTSYSGYGEPTFVICGDSYFSTGGTIELNYNGRTNSPNNGTFRCYHGEYSWQIYNDGDTDQTSGQREINRNVEHRSSSYINSSTQNIDYIPTNDGRYGTNSEPIMDQRSYIRIKMNGNGSHNAIQNHPVFVKFTTYTQGDKTWQAYMYYN